MAKPKSIFVASTGQNIGKTTCSLGIYSGLSKRFSSVGFIKPVGQQHVEISPGVFVDKDVALFQDQFHILDDPSLMSPVLFPRGFTKDFLDGKVSQYELIHKIHSSYAHLSKFHDAMLIEGTGHVGVGSIVGLNNAKVASLLNVQMILIVAGGLGSAFDSLALNKQMCDYMGVNIAGIILNKVIEEKQEMVLEYMHKALRDWKIPIIGCVPFDAFLVNPCMQDFEMLLRTELLSGIEHRYRHFDHIRLIATTVDVYKKLVSPSQLIITPGSRVDIIEETIHQHWQYHKREKDLKAGLILTGSIPPSAKLLAEIKKAKIPLLYAPINSFEVMKMINSYTLKLQKEDKEKIKEAIDVVESHIDFDFLTSIMHLN
ncbi:MAG: AAA family ATPase [Chlamydiales bacterium]|nr:AAA family ATPase [Chlamydiales bacterium]